MTFEFSQPATIKLEDQESPALTAGAFAFSGMLEFKNCSES